ncbi:ankyrin repeat domain-containing protein [Candidatus Tisiphia endosymbiont of Xenochironomus xenolabis]|uniref:ankyrin repeat domain-containing protein n=1 Tax=Candidatus Tisiphia endosymbiont of Xenochironomus xenolabis TaxID=3139334 RepID=UPI0035C89DF8
MLKEASKSQHSAAFDLALAKITDLDYQDIDGKTVLMYAVINGFYYGVDKLLQKGADVNLVDKQDANALIYCVQIPHIKYIKQIAEKTADINYKSALFDGGTALHLIISHTNEIIFASELNNELQDANQLYIVGQQMVIDENFTLRGCGGIRVLDGYTVNQEKTLRTTKFLTDKGADINVQNDKGLTPFFLACDHGFRYLTNELLTQYQGVMDFSLKDVQDNTYLHYAARVPHSIGVMQLMLTKNIHVNTQNKGGGTPALQSAMRNNVETLEFLMKYEADINILDIEGRHLWHYASQYGAINTMKFLKNKIPNIIDLKTTDAVNSTALHIASESGQLVTVQWLVGEYADINAKTTKQGFTPFFIACMKKNTAIAEYIFNHPKFNNTVIDNFGYGYLHWVLEFKDVSWVEKVLNKGGIDINHQDAKGLTALSWCAHYNLPQIIKFLLDNGANSLILSKDGAFPIHEAVATEALEVIKALINYDKTIVDKGDEKKVLWFTAQEGKLEAVKTLLQLGANINAINAVNGMPPLHVAMQKKHPEVAEELLARGADVNIVDAGGWIALHWGVNLEDINIVKNILTKGTNINAKSIVGVTPLFCAVSNGNKLITELLISKQADSNIPSNEGTLPWHIASFKGFIEIMKILAPTILDIDYKTTNSEQYTALWLASQQGHVDIVKWLIDKGADINAIRQSDGRTVLQAAICKEQLQVVECLIANGVNINKADKDGASPLYYSLQNDDELRHQISKILIDHAANINLSPSNDYTPLHMASWLANLPAVKMLLNAGASVNAVDDRGYTPLYSALWESEGISKIKKLDVVKYLLEHSASTDHVANKGETVLEIANKYLPEALQWLKYPGSLPSGEFEASLVGINDFAI